MDLTQKNIFKPQESFEKKKYQLPFYLIFISKEKSTCKSEVVKHLKDMNLDKANVYVLGPYSPSIQLSG